MQVTADSLALGDVVELFEGAYGCGTVKQVTEGEVQIYRPYIHTGNFSYTGDIGDNKSSQVICYIGTETVTLYRKGRRMLKLIKKAEPIK